MSSKSTIKLDNNFFSICTPEAEFTGFFNGFRPTKDYWIGVCQLDKNPFSTQVDENNSYSIDFIICRRKEKTMEEIFNLKTENQNRKLKLIYKNTSKKAYPFFEYKFE